MTQVGKVISAISNHPISTRPVITVVTSRLTDGSEVYSVMLSETVLECATATDCFDLTDALVVAIQKYTGTKPIIKEVNQ